MTWVSFAANNNCHYLSLSKVLCTDNILTPSGSLDTNIQICKALYSQCTYNLYLLTTSQVSYIIHTCMSYELIKMRYVETWILSTVQPRLNFKQAKLQ